MPQVRTITPTGERMQVAIFPPSEAWRHGSELRLSSIWTWSVIRSFDLQTSAENGTTSGYHSLRYQRRESPTITVGLGLGIDLELVIRLGFDVWSGVSHLNCCKFPSCLNKCFNALYSHRAGLQLLNAAMVGVEATQCKCPVCCYLNHTLRPFNAHV